MITATILTHAKSKTLPAESKVMHLYRSMDKAKKELAPIAEKQMECRKRGVQPPQEILDVSYDTEAEKSLLLEMRAILSIDNEFPQS